MAKKIFLKIILGIGIFFVLGNIAFLDFRILTQREKPQVPLEKSISVSTESALPSENICPPACLSIVEKATASTLVLPVTPTPSVAIVLPQVKVFYIPLGGGSTQSKDWADVAGLQVYLDPASFGKIKAVIFEASLRIPTANGRVYARLYNVNDKRPVWFSEISAEGPTSTLIQSEKITLDAGNKLYRVQAKTTMGYESFLDSARVKIITQ